MTQLLENETQIFSAAPKSGDGVEYHFIVSLAGKDGRDRPVWVGKMKNSSPHSPLRGSIDTVALVTRHNNPPYGSPLAIYYAGSIDEAHAAAELAISEKRRGYGTGHANHLENWTSFAEDFHVEGYDYET